MTSTPPKTVPNSPSSPYSFNRRPYGRPFKDDVTCCYELASSGSDSESESSSRSPSPSPSASPTKTNSGLNKLNDKGKGKATAEQEEADEKERMRQEKKARKEERRRLKEEARRRRPSIVTLRSSQGFIWNQDLFVPPHIKDRYIASSPPNVRLSSSAGVFGSSFSGMDFEVECVDIRVEKGEMDGIIPPKKDAWEDGLGWEMEGVNP